jgi:hypothetical protein
MDIFLASSDRIGCSWTELAIQCQQLLARQPQVRHRKQRGEPRGVLPRAMIAHLHVAELPLDHAKRVCDLGAHAGLYLPNLLDEAIYEPGLA